MSDVIRLCAEVVRGVCDEDGPQAETMREMAMAAKREHDATISAVLRARDERDAVVAERDRLRRELEALLDEWSASALDPDAVHYRLDAILRGGES